MNEVWNFLLSLLSSSFQKELSGLHADPEIDVSHWLNRKYLILARKLMNYKYSSKFKVVLYIQAFTNLKYDVPQIFNVLNAK